MKLAYDLQVRPGEVFMAASQVVLYFDRQEDALLFTLAASSVMAAEGAPRATDAVMKIAAELCKATRIKTEGVLDSTEQPPENRLSRAQFA